MLWQMKPSNLFIIQTKKKCISLMMFFPRVEASSLFQGTIAKSTGMMTTKKKKTAEQQALHPRIKVSTVQSLSIVSVCVIFLQI